MLWLGRRRNFEAGYWIGLPWSAFVACLQEEYLADPGRRSASALQQFAAPDRRELAGFPWAGDGPDPLEEA